MSDREQAIKDLAKAMQYAEADIRLCADTGTLGVAYAVSQRERVIALERALREILLPVDIREVHCAEWAEKVRQIARAALNGESK